MMTALFTLLSSYFQPAVGYVGDPMPFYDPAEENFKIMYLQEFRPNGRTFHPFWCLETADAADYTMLGEMIPTGMESELDGALGTGTTIYNEADQTYYTFYTGHSVNISLTGIGEGVMVATSKDFRTWEKNPDFLLTGEGEYDTRDFRDPFVFRDDDGLFRMLVSTLKEGKGVIAEYTSPDLKEWTSAGVFMPMMWDRFYECPDLFRMGDWWYLVYSEKHPALRRVQYFKGRTLDELRACTADDAGIWPDDHEGVLDSRAFYAGKTASDGKERYIWGWCPTRAGEDNTAVGAYPAEPQWAGTLVAHRLVQHPDGSLTLGPVEGIERKYSSPVEVKVMERTGEVSERDGKYELKGESALIFSPLAGNNRIEFTVATAGTADRFGISMARGGDGGIGAEGSGSTGKDYGCHYSMIIDSCPGDWQMAGSGNRRNENMVGLKEGSGRIINFAEEGADGKGLIDGGEGYPFAAPSDNVYHVVICTDTSVCTLYINDTVAYTARIYGLQDRPWSINSYGSNLTVSDLKISGT